MQLKLVEEVQLAATPEQVFKAWTNQALLQSWWGNATFRTTQWEGDLRPGGRWGVRFDDPRGNIFSANGQFLKVDSPRQLSFTWKPDWDADPPTTMDLEFRSTPRGTSLRLTQTGFASESAYLRNQYAWAETLAMLRRFLNSDNPQR